MSVLQLRKLKLTEVTIPVTLVTDEPSLAQHRSTFPYVLAHRGTVFLTTASLLAYCKVIHLVAGFTHVKKTPLFSVSQMAFLREISQEKRTFSI